MTRLFAYIAILTCAGSVLAQDALPDPTRPPTIGQAVSTSSESSAAGLQSIIIPKHGEPSALINGRRVTLGSKVDDAKVVKITESTVVLKGAAGTRTLKIAPDVEKRPSVKHEPTVKRGGAKPE